MDFYVLLFLIISTVSCQTVEDFQSCCPYCRTQPQQWMSVSPAWNLTINDVFVTDFSDPASYYIMDEVQYRPFIVDKEYVVDYAGAPVQIIYEGVGSAGVILNSQFVEVDLTSQTYISGVTVQGGYYEDSTGVLLNRRESWISEFSISYAPREGSSFSYVLHNGQIQVFFGSNSYDDYTMVSFTEPILAEFIRIHPFRAESKYGPEEFAMMRVGVIACYQKEECATSNVHCELNAWSPWSECVEGFDEHYHTRKRTVHKYNSCGGALCGHLSEKEICDPGFALWKLILIIVCCALFLIIIIVVIIVVVVKITKKKKEDQVFVKEEEPVKKEKKRKNRNKRFRKNSGGEIEEVDATETVTKADESEVDDDIEKEAAMKTKAESDREAKREAMEGMTDEQMAAAFLAEEVEQDEVKERKKKKKKKKKRKGRRSSTVSNMDPGDADADVPDDIYEENEKKEAPSPVVVDDDPLPGSEKAKEAEDEPGTSARPNAKDDQDEFDMGYSDPPPYTP